jgi:hypothetical protein
MPAHRRHAARTRRVSAAGLAPTSGEIVTQIQLGGSRPDSAVRVRYAQPRSRLKPHESQDRSPTLLSHRRRTARPSTVTTNRRERSFDDPPFRQHLKSSSGIVRGFGNKPLYRVLDIDGLIGFEPEFRRILNCRPGRDRQRGIKFELADGDWMTSSLPKNSEAGDAKLDGRVRSPVGAVAQGNSTSPGPHGTREARSAEPSGAFSGLQLTADETPNENPAPRRRTGGVPRLPGRGGLSLSRAWGPSRQSAGHSGRS